MEEDLGDVIAEERLDTIKGIGSALVVNQDACYWRAGMYTRLRVYRPWLD